MTKDIKEILKHDKAHTKELLELRGLVQKSQCYKDVLKQEWQDDSVWFRYLRARDYDVQRAMVMVENYYKFIRESKVMSCTADDLKEFLQHKMITYMGYDRNGRAAVVFQPEHLVPGTIDPDQATKGFLTVLLLMSQEVKAKGEQRFHLIFRYDNWGLKNIDRKLDKALTKAAQDLFPERLFKLHFVRPPWLFSAAWSVVKYFIHKNTVAKFEWVKTGNLDGHFDKFFAKDQRLKEWGGSSQPISLYDYAKKAMGDKTLLETLQQRAKEFGFDKKHKIPTEKPIGSDDEMD